MKGSNHMLTLGYDVGNRSGRILMDQHRYIAGKMNETLKSFSGKLTLNSSMDRYWENDKARITGNESYRY